ncbi:MULTISPECIES: hypothetical protein [Bradyrhizobium]|uniref:Uncharacterized protein n=2 Tax=Bradyrhizobium arachidis TaxID=858423 RepID=A0AAE7NKC5_9BRAD|nr:MULTISPECIES: hypothetical protein [Bradyrhizobium]QOG22153.1 hypothetical protein FOM02_37510 [Bradyrhizobium sp. SEMIA]QOZ66927.1 hypothetical protein WN72_11850 [Bradyrhizobium arachidis]UFW51631.1 hypothetical protein BaraCB756_11930 [Bradyrhizobium arachidis]SFV13779.1 hypothetical protein SAMN05192541_120112 [Bradyrhizobium arachidis]
MRAVMPEKMMARAIGPILSRAGRANCLREILPVFVLGTICVVGGPAFGQASLANQPLSDETVGGSGKFATSSPLTQPKSFTVSRPRALDPTGKPCLTVSSTSESQTLNKNVFNHILILDNHCGKQIRIRACYYKTDSCTTMSVGGYRRQQHILGIFSYSDFQYSFREYAN